MVTFQKYRKLLLLIYEPDSGFNVDSNWLYGKLNTYDSVTISKVYEFTKAHLHGNSKKIPNDLGEPLETPVAFIFGTLNGEYYALDQKVLSIDFPVYIHKNIQINHKFFAATKNVAIFPIINSLEPKEIYIGGKHQGAITKVEFQRMIKQIPSNYEIKKYVLARVSAVTRELIETQQDGESKYNQYMNRKSYAGTVGLTSPAEEEIKEGEKLKYTYLLKQLENMLINENQYNEKQWQRKILQIILLLYPKYIKVFENTPIKDSYNHTSRKLDFLLVDSTGNVDIVEIKKPFDQCIVTRTQYRDNHVPLRELSGAVMQVEKYIFYLNKWGKEGEDQLSARYKNELPKNMSIKITNPSGLIIMGRDDNLDAIQKQDFEVIKRKYKNVIDIITYNDLINRLRFTIAQLSIP